MLVLHIGLPKTGTTFLQHRVFPSAPELRFVHRRHGEEAAALCRDLRRYGTRNALAAAVLRRRLRRALVVYVDSAAPLVISDESISVRARGFWQGEGATPARLAGRLASLAAALDRDFGPLRVVIGIRRQDRWLASRYAESSNYFPDFGQIDFDRRMMAIAAAPELAGVIAWLDFDAVRRHFAAALGPQNVHLIPLERLAGAPPETLAQLGDFLGGIDLAPSALAGAPPARNRLAKGVNVWRLRRDGSVLRLGSSLQAALRDRFAASNRAIAALVPLGFDG